MAVSLKDAWNEFSDDEELPAMSAKISRKSETEIKDSKPIEVNPISESKSATLETMSMLVQEIQELRREESKRCFVYLVFSGILFAILLIYIERLQNRIKSLTNTIRHIQLRNAIHSNISPQNTIPHQMYQ